MLSPTMREAKTKLEELKQQLAAATLPAFRAQILLDLSDEVFYSAPAEAEAYLLQAIEDARAAKHVEVLCRAFTSLAYIRNQAGRLDEGRELARKSLRIARRKGFPRIEASANNVLGTIFFQQGEHPAALQHYEECLRLSRESGYDAGVSTALGNIALVYRNLGQVRKALDFDLQSVELERQREDWLAVAIGLANVGGTYEDLGDWGKALEYYYTALAAAEATNNRTVIASCLACIAYLFIRRGRVDWALDLLPRAIEIVEQLGYADQRAEYYGLMAQACLTGGDPAQAREWIKRSLEVAEFLGDKEEIARARRRYAEVLLTDGDTGKAAEQIRQALQISVESGQRIIEGTCWRVLGNVLQAQNVPAEAQAAFERAISTISATLVGDPTSIGGDCAPQICNYELACAHYDFARFLVTRHETQPALEHVNRASAIFRSLGITTHAGFRVEPATESGTPEH
jgi:tetratricopeptide (TPR) repeat protein